MTTSGWKRMIDLTLKDLIFGSDGLPHKIKGIYNKGLKKVYKISFSDTSSVKCCEDHLWSVYSPRDKWMGWSNKVLPLKDIMKMELKTEKKSKANLLFIPILSAPINFPFKKLIIPPYTMGALLGDGGLLHGVCFSNTDKDIIKRVSNEIKNLGYSLRKIKGDNVDYRIIKTDQTHKTKKNKITAIIKKYKLNVKSIDKHIPKRYKFSSAEQRIQLLQGLMDTDGWASLKNGILQFSTTSVRLCNDVQFLIESLGGIAKKKGYDHNYIYKGKKRQAHKAYCLTIALPNQISPFFCERKKKCYRLRTKYGPSRAFTKIEYVKEDLCFCISVDTKDHLYVTEHCILTHNTIQALAWLEMHPELRPALIVCPSIGKLHWATKAEEWMSNPNTEILNGEKPWIPEGDILIINYDILPKWKEVLIRVNAKVFITDECHKYKNNTAKRTKAVKQIGRFIPHIIAISGTPIINRPVEIYNAVNLVDPTIFPSYWQFTRRYCQRHRRRIKGRLIWDFSGHAHMDELYKILTSTIMIRRLKKDVLKELPNKIPSFVPIEINNQNDYNYAERHFIQFVKELKGNKAAKKAARAESFTKIEGLRQLALKGKLNNVIEWIEDFLESDQKLVVFAHHKSVIETLVNAFPDISVKIDGSCTNIQKHRAEKEFQTNDEIRLFIGNMQAAGEVITLTAASNIAIIELPWTPGELSQAIDRCHRIGQKYSLTIHYLLAAGTIEKKFAEVLDRKRIITDAILDGKATRDEDLLTELISEYRKVA